MFSIGQEFVVAWAKLWIVPGMPLHMVALWIMSFFAASSLLWIYGLARELTGHRGWGLFATALALVLLGNYRTIGFILIREDFSMPWLAMHVYALARAARLRTPGSIAFAGIAMLLAVATWHAMGFMLTIEAAVFFAWHLRSGDNPMKIKGAWLFPLVLAVGCVLVPVLRSKGFLFSFPMLVITSLGLTAMAEARGLLQGRTRWLAPVLLVLLIPCAGLLSRAVLGGANDYAHVYELISAKLKYMGVRPADPSGLSFDTRLLWQGPFATPTWEYFSGALGAGLLALLFGAVAGAVGWVRGKGDRRHLLLFAFAVGGVVAALLVRRTIVLPTLMAPVIAAIGLQQLRQVQFRWILLVAGFALQAQAFNVWVSSHRCLWYEPTQRNVEMAEALRWIETNIPAKQPIASDFVTGTAVLAHAGNPMLVQPKYETTSSRRRIETFMRAFSSGSLADYAQLLEDNQCRFVLTNFDYWSKSFYEMGFVPSQTWRPPVDSPFSWFCSQQPATYRNVPGFELVYQSKNRFGRDYFRIFRRKGPGEIKR
jgi:hypothetical protein